MLRVVLQALVSRFEKRQPTNPLRPGPFWSMLYACEFFASQLQDRDLQPMTIIAYADGSALRPISIAIEQVYPLIKGRVGVDLTCFPAAETDRLRIELIRFWQEQLQQPVYRTPLINDQRRLDYYFDVQMVWLSLLERDTEFYREVELLRPAVQTSVQKCLLKNTEAVHAKQKAFGRISSQASPGQWLLFQTLLAALVKDESGVQHHQIFAKNFSG
jgi:hypothetical protein